MRFIFSLAFALLFFPGFSFGQNFKNKSYTSFYIISPYTIIKNTPKNTFIRPKLGKGVIGGTNILYSLNKNIAAETGIYIGKLSYIWDLYDSDSYFTEKNNLITAGIPLHFHIICKIKKKHFYSVSLGTNYNYSFLNKSGTFSIGIDDYDFISGMQTVETKPQITLNFSINYYRIRKKNKYIKLSIIYQAGLIKNTHLYYRLYPYTENEIKGIMTTNNSYIGLSLTFIKPNNLFSN